MTSRDIILSKIKATRALKNQEIEIKPAPIASGLHVPKGDLAQAFKKSIETVQGECYIIENKEVLELELLAFLSENNINSDVMIGHSLKEEFPNLLEDLAAKNSDNIQAGITCCELLIAQTGTAIVTSRAGRKTIGLSPIHIILANRSQLRLTLDEGIKEMADKYGTDLPSQLTLITGPSRTADIEKTLILGAHGPKRLVVFIY